MATAHTNRSDLQGIIGNAMPAVKTLELPGGDGVDEQ